MNCCSEDLDETDIFTPEEEEEQRERTCGIRRKYFDECSRTGELTLGQPTYRQCMDDRRCVYECVEAQVRRLTRRCTGTRNLGELSCFDVARIHRGRSQRCLNVNANFYAYVVNSICMGKYSALPCTC